MTDIGVRFTGTFTETNNEFRVWLYMSSMKRIEYNKSITVTS